MSKTEAQLRNEEEVRRIMKERSYDFWSEPEKSKKKKKSKTKTITKVSIVILSVALIAVSGVVIFRKIDENKKAQFDDCMTKSSDEYLEANEDGGHYVGMIAQDDAQIQCYEKYGGSEKEEKIAELNKHKDNMNKEINNGKLALCINEADDNYAISEEELNNAGTDVNALLILVKRRGAGIEAKMDCHNKYRTSSYETEMNKLRAEKSENEAYISDAENSIKYEQTRPVYQQPASNSVHCSSRSIGSSIYTDCN